MKRITAIFFISFILNANSAFTQNAQNYKTTLPTGITLHYGLGNFSVKDEYISKEKYSGSLPYLSANWTRFKNNSGLRLGFEFRNSSNIKNNNVTADIMQFSLNQNLFFSIPKLSLFNRDLFTFLGPSMEFYFYFNDQNIAVSGFDYAQSYAALFSLGINLESIFPMREDLHMEVSYRMGLLSLGVRMIDSEEEDVPPAKLLTFLAGTHASIKLGVRYYLINNLSLKIAYKLNVTRISSWNPLLSASDNLIATVTYGF